MPCSRRWWSREGELQGWGRKGKKSDRRAVVTDGGVFDSLGISCIEPPAQGKQVLTDLVGSAVAVALENPALVVGAAA